jgi:hypothetical protein
MVNRKERLASELGVFVAKYGRKHGPPRDEPNDRKYDRRIEQLVKQMDPQELDALLRGDDPPPR